MIGLSGTADAACVGRLQHTSSVAIHFRPGHRLFCINACSPPSYDSSSLNNFIHHRGLLSPSLADQPDSLLEVGQATVCMIPCATVPRHGIFCFLCAAFPITTSPVSYVSISCTCSALLRTAMLCVSYIALVPSICDIALLPRTCLLHSSGIHHYGSPGLFEPLGEPKVVA